MNSFDFFLSGKHFICPSTLSDNFAGQSNLGCRSLLFMTLTISCQSLLACKVSFEKSADSLMKISLQVTFFFLLLLRSSLYVYSLAFNYDVSWSGIHLLWDSLCFLDLYVYFFHQVREVFCYHFFQIVFQFLALSLIFLAPL